MRLHPLPSSLFFSCSDRSVEENKNRSLAPNIGASDATVWVSIDGFNFLIDCGWNDHSDPSILQPLARPFTSNEFKNNAPQVVTCKV